MTAAHRRTRLHDGRALLKRRRERARLKDFITAEQIDAAHEVVLGSGP
jgi:hypothetical protein